MLAMNKDRKCNSLRENLNFGVSQKNCVQIDSIFLSSDREPYFDLKLIFLRSVLVLKHFLRAHFSDNKNEIHSASAKMSNREFKKMICLFLTRVLRSV